MASNAADERTSRALGASTQAGRPQSSGRTGSIPRSQLAALFGYSLVIWSLGNGVLPLLPNMAELLGADDTATGLYLASSYAAIALGTVVAGWVADRLGPRKAFMLLAGAAGSPVVLVTSAVTAFWQLVLLTAAAWWLGGTVLALATIRAGLLAGPTERGKVLGVLALAGPAGSVLGGIGVGALADALGYSRMWIAFGFLWLLCPVAGVFVRDATGPGHVSPAPRAVPSGVWSRAFFLLLICGILGSAGSFIGALGRTLAMRHTFNAAAITSTVAVSGLVTLPFPAVMGSLSDRLGRLRFLGLCYAAGVGGLLVYSVATSLWNFWIAASLLAFVSYVSPGVGSALVVDLVDRRSLGRGLALFSATGWAGAILGFSGGGFAFERIGHANGFLLGAGLTVVGILLLVPIRLAIISRRSRMTLATPAMTEPRKE